MADPRKSGPQMRTANHSPLMKSLLNKMVGGGVMDNYCPYGCEDHQLDELGCCGHLIGYYAGGQTFEPRVRRKQDNRIIVSGIARTPMKAGYKLVRITTTARVYSPVPNKTLMVSRDESERHLAVVVEEERRLLAAAENIRNPILDGDWSGGAYDISPTAPKPPVNV